jgi:hypothetical protein
MLSLSLYLAVSVLLFTLLNRAAAVRVPVPVTLGYQVPEVLFSQRAVAQDALKAVVPPIVDDAA